MQFEMKMPDLATTDSEIRIARWLIETGQKVERGQPLLEVETDKATMEVESVASGVLAEVRAAANEAVSVGQVIAVMEVEGASPAAAAPAAIAPDTREAAEGVPPLHKSSAGTGPSASTACERAVAHAAATPGRTSGGMFGAIGPPLPLGLVVQASRLPGQPGRLHRKTRRSSR